MGVAEVAMEILHEMGLEPKSIVVNEYIDCFCYNENCNTVRGVHILVIELANSRYAVFRWYSHTQTDCDVVGSECDVEKMDVKSLEFLGIYNNWNELYSKVCPYGDYDDP